MVSTNAESELVSASPAHMIKKGLNAGLPVMIGYLPIAIAYGVLAKQAGLSLPELTMMSVLVYAGASQFMGVNMIAAGTGAMEIVIATFVLNFRHFIMSFAFMNQLKKVSLKWKVPLSFGLTDESFAVSALNPEEANKRNGALFYGTIIVIAYLSWIAGSFLGGLLGEVIPERLSQSMGIALYAMFIGLLIPSVKKERKVGLIALFGILIHIICLEIGLSTGWSIVAGTIIGGMSGIYLLREGER